jgi:hypothetical protein
VEAKFRKNAVTELKKGGVRSIKRKNWLIYVLRLRQAASHPFLLESVMKEHFDSEDIRWLIEQLSKVQTRTPFINQIGLWCEEQLQVQNTQGGGSESRHKGLDARFAMIRQLKQVEKHTQEEV